MLHSLRVKQKRRETADAVSLTFDIPHALADHFQFHPGQYLTIQSTIEGEKVRRPYSICSGLDDGEVRVAVKEVENGRFSSFVNRVLLPGDVVQVMAPSGRFVLPPASKPARNIMAVVAGSGITPIISIVKTVLTRERESRVLLLCGNRRWKDILFRDELADLERSFPERFVLRHFLSRESDDGDFVKGRIDGDAVEATLTRLDVPVSSIDHALLCGPVDMVKTINDRLLWCGITSDKIAYELFEATTGPAVSPQSNDGNEAIVEIVLDSESRVFQATSMDTIVGAALRAGVDVPYSCGSGTCCSCLAKLVHGEVHQRSNSALQPSEIEAGLVLTCQTTAISRRILIDYDAAF